MEILSVGNIPVIWEKIWASRKGAIMNYFAEFHPIVNFSYFAAVLLFSMFMMHPVFVILSLLTGVIYLCTLKGVRFTLRAVRFPLILAIVVAVLNPVFNHRGVSILFYNRIGNPVTKEAIIFGIAMGMLLMAVMIWFMCYRCVMSSDKFIYLFGRIIPGFSLIISMALRYVPRFKQQFGKIRQSRKAIGKDFTDGNLIARIKIFSAILSIMISWSLENSIETADSMKARGYGLKGRTAFSMFRFTGRDVGPMLMISISSATLVFGIWKDKLYYSYYPYFEKQIFEPGMVIYYMLFAVLCLIPVMLEQIYKNKYKDKRTSEKLS